MRLTTLKIQHFRNHRESYFEFVQGANILLGDNGQGKTNVLEAISYLCLTKSFYAMSDALVLTVGEDLFQVEGTFCSDAGREYRVRVAYQQSAAEKSVTINRQRIEPFSSIIGKFPIVISSPEHAPITGGGPVERRKFVDFVISQANAPYFQSLIEYRNVLRQRNRVLLDGKLLKRDVDGVIGPWDEQLVRHGAEVIARRKEFIGEFQQYTVTAYGRLVTEDETPSMAYQPSVLVGDTGGAEGIAERFRSELEARRDEERRAGTTLVGPHRDEVVFAINGLELRKFASQGQHKTFLVALKLAEFFYLKDRCQETPVILLDDIFSELDEPRARQLLSCVSDMSQTFITSTNPHYFDAVLHAPERDRIFSIREGSVISQTGALAS